MRPPLVPFHARRVVRASRVLPSQLKLAWEEDHLLDQGPEGCWLRPEHLADRLGCAPRVAERYRRELEQLGLHQSFRPPGAGRGRKHWYATLPAVFWPADQRAPFSEVAVLRDRFDAFLRSLGAVSISPNSEIDTIKDSASTSPPSENNSRSISQTSNIKPTSISPNSDIERSSTSQGSDVEPPSTSPTSEIDAGPQSHYPVPVNLTDQCLSTSLPSDGIISGREWEGSGRGGWAPTPSCVSNTPTPGRGAADTERTAVGGVPTEPRELEPHTPPPPEPSGTTPTVDDPKLARVMKRFHAKQRELGDAEDQAHARRVATHREASS